jgi:hypothetical protein
VGQGPFSLNASGRFLADLLLIAGCSRSKK